MTSFTICISRIILLRELHQDGADGWDILHTWVKTNATVFLEESEEERSLSRRTWEIVLKFIIEK
jgi:hypothetical protein